MRNFYLLLFAFFFPTVSAQTIVSVPVIQGSGSTSSYSGHIVSTGGIVTAMYVGSGMINGFFIQDAVGDGNPNTSDGIFVYSAASTVSVGDKIQLTAKVTENNGRTQLSEVTGLSVISKNNPLPVVKIVYDMFNPDWEKYEGMLVEFQQTLFVNSTYNLEKYGELELGLKRTLAPTNVAFPGSSEYKALVNENSLPPLYLDDAYISTYISPIVLADENGTRRTGERVDKLQAVVDFINSNYVIYPAHFPVNFYGNPRKMKPDDIGNCNLKVCGFNMEYYLTTPHAGGIGPATQTELDRQHTKIVDALLAIDADIYGLVEIEQGQTALTKLSQALNSATASNHYNFINDNGTVNGTYTKVAYLYRSDKVAPYQSLKNNNSTGPVNRKKLQAFTLKSNNERFIFSINHFKAKSGCSSASGADADQGDGQSCYNAARVAEANSVITSIKTNNAYYADEDALVMGDLNAYAEEDPIQTFVNAGYTDLQIQFHADSAYSYVYRGEAGYLDQALANETLVSQVTGVTVFHINADEPSMFEYSGTKYQPDMYRSSDHDPVVVGLRLGENVNVNTLPFEKRVKIYPAIVDEILHIDNAENAYVQIFAMSGIKIHQEKLTSGWLNVNDLGLIPGVYIVRVLGENKIASQIITVK